MLQNAAGSILVGGKRGPWTPSTLKMIIYASKGPRHLLDEELVTFLSTQLLIWKQEWI